MSEKHYTENSNIRGALQCAKPSAVACHIYWLYTYCVYAISENEVYFLVFGGVQWAIFDYRCAVYALLCEGF